MLGVVHEAPQRVVDRIFGRVDTSDPDACWLWPGALSQGYGRIAWSLGASRMTYGFVHRVMYEAVNGPVPNALDLDHRCHDPATCRPSAATECPHRRCCNPRHLEPATRQTNLLRGNTTAARRAAVTHCPQGHPYDETNTARDKLGRRSCRECTRLANRAYYWRNRERRSAYNKTWRENRKNTR